MGQEISYRHPFLAGKLTKPEPLFSVHGGDTQTDLHDQYSRRVPPPNPQGDKDKGRIRLRRVPIQACLSGVPQQKKEMDHDLGKLVLNRSATMYKVRESI
jgi:hypothetical protein